MGNSHESIPRQQSVGIQKYTMNWESMTFMCSMLAMLLVELQTSRTRVTHSLSFGSFGRRRVAGCWWRESKDYRGTEGCRRRTVEINLHGNLRHSFCHTFWHVQQNSSKNAWKVRKKCLVLQNHQDHARFEDSGLRTPEAGDIWHRLYAAGCLMMFEIGRVEYMGVSKNRGTPKWMVYNGKPY